MSPYLLDFFTQLTMNCQIEGVTLGHPAWRTWQARHHYRIAAVAVNTRTLTLLKFRLCNLQRSSEYPPITLRNMPREAEFFNVGR